MLSQGLEYEAANHVTEAGKKQVSSSRPALHNPFLLVRPQSPKAPQNNTVLPTVDQVGHFTVRP